MAALRLFLLAAAGLTYALIDDWPALTLVSCCLLAVLSLAWLWSRASLTGIAFGRRLSSDHLQVGEELSELARIDNRSLIGKVFVEIDDRSTLPGHSASRVVTLGPHSSREWSVSSVARSRGYHRLGPVSVRSGDPLGIFRRTKHLTGALDVTIYPMTVALDRYTPISALQTGGGVIQRRSSVPTATVGGIRDYSQGDSINRISWTSTAWAGRLMVKEFETDPTADLWVVLDLFATPDGLKPASAWDLASDNTMLWLGNEFEYRIMLSSSLVKRTLSLGRSVGVIFNSPQPVVLPPERSDRQYIRILQHLAVIEPIPQPTLTEVLTGANQRFRRDSAVVVITSDPEATLAGVLGRLKRRRISPEIVFVDYGMEPQGLRADMASERIPCYRLTRFDNPTVALNSSLIGLHGVGY